MHSDEVSPLINRIIDLGREKLGKILGKFGVQLFNFLCNVDLSHPDTEKTCSAVFNFDNEFTKELNELLELGEYALSNGLMRVLPISTKTLNRREEANVIKNVYVRLFKDENKRRESRLEKKMQVVDLAGFYKKSRDIWNKLPDNFSNFYRFQSPYVDEIKEAEQKAMRYAELGCSGLANQIVESIKVFTSQIVEAYHGFNRITMTNACVILAKLSGYKFLTVFPEADSQLTEYRIHAPTSCFKGYNSRLTFDPNTEKCFPYLTGNVNESIEFKYNQNYDYQPKAYPFHELENIASDFVIRTVRNLEAFPGIGYKPIFDHYIVLVPSVLFPRSESQNSLLNPIGKEVYYGSRLEANVMLDRYLIHTKIIKPVLLGEKDGKCYFICEWD